jgi:uridine kinase
MKGDILVVDKKHIQVANQIADILLNRITERKERFGITIAGESGSGKSEIASALSDIISNFGIGTKIIQQDDYFLYPPKTNAEIRKKDIGYVGMSEVRLNLLEDNLKEIMSGKDIITKPLVLFDKDRITEEELPLKGIKVIIIDGTYTTTLKNVHQRIFIDRTFIDTREDRQRRNRETQDSFLEQILKIEHYIISPHKDQADIIITKDYELGYVRSGNTE